MESYVLGASNLGGDNTRARCSYTTDLGSDHFEYECTTEVDGEDDFWLPYQRLTVNWDGGDDTGEITDACNEPLTSSEASPDAPLC